MCTYIVTNKGLQMVWVPEIGGPRTAPYWTKPGYKRARRISYLVVRLILSLAAFAFFSSVILGHVTITRRDLRPEITWASSVDYARNSSVSDTRVAAAIYYLPREMVTDAAGLLESARRTVGSGRRPVAIVYVRPDHLDMAVNMVKLCRRRQMFTVQCARAYMRTVVQPLLYIYIWRYHFQ